MLSFCCISLLYSSMLILRDILGVALKNLLRRIRMIWFGLNGLLRQYFSLYRTVSQREREKELRNDRREKKCPNNPTRTPTASTAGPWPTIAQISRNPAPEFHPAPSHNPTATSIGKDWLVGCFGLNGPSRQYFSLYQAVSQREGGLGKVC